MMFALILIFSVVLSTAAERDRLPSRTVDDTPDDVAIAAQIEKEMFGKSVLDMDENDFSAIYRSFGRDRGSSRASKVPEYQLVGVPLVYHSFVNQTLPNNETRRLITKKQMFWASNLTNRLFNIYNRNTKSAIQFATFVTEGLYLNTVYSNTTDCKDIDSGVFNATVSKIPEWQFKIHVINCGSLVYGSLSFLPNRTYSVDNFRLNTIFIEDFSFACYDDDGNNLCETPQRIMPVRSASVTQHVGHVFGLYVTHKNGCRKGGDGVSDTPAETGKKGLNGCPGLLPYDKDRDLFTWSKRRSGNKYNSPTECFLHNRTCQSTCVACVDKFYNASCCSSNEPFDSCRFKAGVDPLNNIMTFAPDICKSEFTPGQMVKMMAQTRTYKKYLYCNYATVVDSEVCSNIPCASTATSPNCKK